MDEGRCIGGIPDVGVEGWLGDAITIALNTEGEKYPPCISIPGVFPALPGPPVRGGVDGSRLNRAVRGSRACVMCI